MKMNRTDRRIHTLIASALAVGLGMCALGCADPLEGSWERRNPDPECPPGTVDTMEIAGDLSARAKIKDCDDGIIEEVERWNLDFTEDGELEWELEADESGSSDTAECVCKLKKDGEELDCGGCGDDAKEFGGDWRLQD